MIFSPEGVVSFEDYEYQIKAVCKMVSNRNHAFGAAEVPEKYDLSTFPALIVVIGPCLNFHPLKDNTL